LSVTVADPVGPSQTMCVLFSFWRPLKWLGGSVEGKFVLKQNISGLGPPSVFLEGFTSHKSIDLFPFFIQRNAGAEVGQGEVKEL